MILQKTIKARIIGLTKSKEQALNKEYNNWQTLIQSLNTNNPNCIQTYQNTEIYSATKQQALRYCRKLKSKNQPLIIRRDAFNIQRHNTKLSNYWTKIPIFRKSIKVPIHFAKRQEHLLAESIRQAKLIRKTHRKKTKWLLHITVQKEIKIKKSYSSVLSIDLGEKVIATSVVSVTNSITFYGKEVRGIRRHYSWLRKRLGNRSLLKTIKKINQKEKRKTNDILHKISKQIVDEAKQTNSVIVLGNLKGIRNSAKGKRMNRIVSNMPYHKLTKFIEYKANWSGIKVAKISERGTSLSCHRCKQKGSRPKQSVFNCRHCGLKDYNADLNAARNIAERFSGQQLKAQQNAVDVLGRTCLKNGVVLNSPLSRT